MSYTQQLVYETLRSIDSATFTGSYQTLGTPLSHPTSIIKMVNNSSALVTISTDGIHDMDILPANGFWLYDVTTNHSTSTPAIFIPSGTQFLVKGTASTGLVYLVVQYIIQV